MPRLLKASAFFVLLTGLASCNGSGPAGPDSEPAFSDALGIPGIEFSTTTISFPSGVSRQDFTMKNIGGTPLNWKITTVTAPWVTVSPTSGKLDRGSSMAVTVRIDRSQLSPGNHSAAFSMTAGSKMAVVTVRVSDTTTTTPPSDSTAPKLGASPDSLDFGSTTTELPLRIVNNGSQELTWSAQPSTGWVTVSSSSGRLAAGAGTTLTVRVSRSGLSGGSHVGTIGLTSNGGSKNVKVKAQVVSPSALRLSQTSLAFGTSATALNLRIFNDGGQPLTWSATSSAAWLTLSAMSGSVPAGSYQDVQAKAARSTLAAGDYVGSLQFTSNAGNATVTATLSKTESTPTPPGAINVRDWGAVGDGVTDDIAAFEDALLKLRSSGGGTLFVPAGTYILKPYRMGALELLAGYSNITIAGEGAEQSILRMAPAAYTGAIHVILIQNVSGITIRDLTLDGNEPNATYQNQQTHGIEVRNSQDVRFERLQFMRLHGDGVRMVGQFTDVGPWVERVVVKNSRFLDMGRSGVGINRAVRDVKILNNTFDRISDQALSAEPGGRELGGVAPYNILMDGNVIRESRGTVVSLEGPTPTDVAHDIVFRNNRVETGSVRFRSVDNVRIEGNVLIGSLTQPALELLGNVTDMKVVGNEVSGEGGGSGVVQALAEYDARAYPAHVTISNNRIRARTNQSGILIQDALGDVTILDNEIIAEAGRIGIDVYNRVTIDSLRSGFIIGNNLVRNFGRGVRFARDGDFYGSVTIETNTINHNQVPPTETVGIVFSETGPYETFATLLANIFGAGIETNIVVVTE